MVDFWRKPEFFPADLGRRVGYTLDKVPGHRRVAIRTPIHTYEKLLK